MNKLEIIRWIIKGLFFAVFPGVVIFFRLKKKIKTGFAVGIVLTLFLLGIIISSSIQENPVKKFISLTNSSNYSDAKKAYKILIQFGPDYLSEIEEEKIIEKDLFARLKKDLIAEYEGVAQKINEKYSVDEAGDCSDLLAKKNAAGHLKHAVRLTGYAESIGGSSEKLKKQLEKKIISAEKIISMLEEKCQ